MIRIERGEDINALRGMIEAGLISQDDLSKMTITGGLVSSRPQQFHGSRNGEEMQGQQQAKQPARKLRVIGYGNGQVTDLGEEDWKAPPLDYTRGGIEIAGVGKGHYSADGRAAYVQTPQGMTKVILGYDADASDRRNDAALKREMTRLQIEQEGLQNEGLRLRNSALANPELRVARGPSRTMSDGGPDNTPQKMTESQGKALSFGMRAANASEMLDLVGQGGEVQPGLIKRIGAAIPLVGDGLATALNWTQSPEQQQVERAQRDFINAILRRESGAVISEGEFNNAAQQYFPQPNDSPEVKADKRRARALAIAGLQQEVEGVRPGVIQGEAMKARAIFDARKALRQGAPRDAVIQRMKQLGLSEKDL